MKKKLIVLLLALLAFAVCGCGNELTFNPLLNVCGDVDNVLSFSAAENDFSQTDYTFEDGKYSGYKLADILQAAGVKSENSKIYFMAVDGMMAAIDYKDLAENYITFTEKGWEAMNVDYPPSCNVKEMKQIVVVDMDETPDYGVKVNFADGTSDVLTCGELLVGDQIDARKVEGTNEKGGRQVTVITTVSGLYIPDYLDGSADSLISLGDADGKSAFYYADGYLKANGNVIDYVSVEHKENIADIRSIALKSDE